MLAATVSLTLTGCGSNDASSSAPAASAAPAETTAAADSAAASVEPISAEEPANSFSYIGSDEKTPTDTTVQGSVTAIEGDTISLTIGGSAMGTPPDMPQGGGGFGAGTVPLRFPQSAGAGAGAHRAGAEPGV